MTDTLIERMRNNDVRVGQIIHIPSMIAPDYLSQETEVRDFLDDTLDAELAERLETRIPGISALVAACEEELRTAEEEEEDERLIRDMNREQTAAFLATRSPCDWLVQVQWQNKECMSRGERFPLGAWRGGWGYYATTWYAGKSVNDCIRQGLVDAESQHRASWTEAKEQPKRQREEEE